MENETISALEALKAAEKATADARAALVEEAATLKTRLAAIHSALGRKPRTKKAKADAPAAKTKEKGAGR